MKHLLWICFGFFCYSLNAVPPHNLRSTSEEPQEEALSRSQPRWSMAQVEAQLDQLGVNQTHFVTHFPVVRIIDAPTTATSLSQIRTTLQRFPVELQVRLMGQYMAKTNDLQHVHLAAGRSLSGHVPSAPGVWTYQRFHTLLDRFQLTPGEFCQHFPFHTMTRSETNTFYSMLPPSILRSLHHAELRMVHEQRFARLQESFLQRTQREVAANVHPAIQALPAEARELLTNIRFERSDSNLTKARKYLRVALAISNREIDGLSTQTKNEILGISYTRSALSFMLARLEVVPFPLSIEGSLALASPTQYVIYDDLTRSSLQTLNWARRYVAPSVRARLQGLEFNIRQQDATAQSIYQAWQQAFEFMSAHRFQALPLGPFAK